MGWYLKNRDAIRKQALKRAPDQQSDHDRRVMLENDLRVEKFTKSEIFLQAIGVLVKGDVCHS